MRVMHILPIGMMLAFVSGAADARVDPVGFWSCVLYGQDRESDERLLLDLRVDGGTWLAELDKAPYQWTPMTQWTERRGIVRFSDARRGREYQADLDYESLGGIWIGATFSGGWWCAPLDERPELSPRNGAFNEYSVMPRLIVDTMASPWYPRGAIREAKEGYAVACFLVQPDGFVTDVRFIELSDPIFELPATGALHRSHYQSWDSALPSRPACRTFDFNLEGRRF